MTKTLTAIILSLSIGQASAAGFQPWEHRDQRNDEISQPAAQVETGPFYGGQLPQTPSTPDAVQADVDHIGPYYRQV
jgi:hypothetical protein